MTDAARAIASAQHLLARGDVMAARREGQALLRTATEPFQLAHVHLLLAACAQRTNDTQGALRHVRGAMELAPGEAAAHYVQAELLESLGDMPGAVTSVERAVALRPEFVQGWFYLGILYGEQGDAAAASRAFETTIRLDPRHARAWNNLGNAWRNEGRLDDAKHAFAQAVAAKPDYPLAVANLAKALRDTGEVEEAERVLREALARASAEPPYRPLLVLLAGLARERGQLDEAAQLYWGAIQAAPRESAGEWFSLGWVLSERGDPAQAHEAYVTAYALDPRDLRALFAQHLALPMVYADAAAVDEARAAYTRGIDALERSISDAAKGLTAVQVIDGLRWTNFFLAYQGRNDRELQERYARLAAGAIENAVVSWAHPMPRAPVAGRRIRIGFASAFLHVGTVGRYFRSWMTELPRERFELYIYHLWPGMDEIARSISERADYFRTFGGSEARPSVVAPAIQRDGLDILVYPELGMDVSSFALAALRLAPRQYAAWGHPVTTGHRTIDRYITCESMEAADASEQYSEPLLMLPGIGTQYTRPEVPDDVSREAFNLPHDRTLLLCPQSLFKIHPENDDLFARVLESNPRAMLVLFAGRHPAITDQYMRRLERTLAARRLDIRARVRVLPQLGHPDFMRVNRVCDAMLDTLHWSGGNTSLDALASALPTVTLPGAYMRGRQSAAMLRIMGVDELIASDVDAYVGIATRLVQDVVWRETLRTRLGAAQDALFGRREALEALFTFFEHDATAAH
ncbi:MAG: tetratricopeptide repeat protein [Pseudomonadota bacterium]|nr:tetratricopeptide repeat protein [Pseudomonadota bacterium]